MDLVQVEVNTGDASPKRQPVRRMPFAVRREVTKQLKSMQESELSVLLLTHGLAQ